MGGTYEGYHGNRGRHRYSESPDRHVLGCCFFQPSLARALEWQLIVSQDPTCRQRFNLVHTNTNFSANGKVGENTSLVFQDPFVSVSVSNNVKLQGHLANTESALESVGVSPKYNIAQLTRPSKMSTVLDIACNNSASKENPAAYGPVLHQG